MGSVEQVVGTMTILPLLCFFITGVLADAPKPYIFRPTKYNEEEKGQDYEDTSKEEDKDGEKVKISVNVEYSDDGPAEGKVHLMDMDDQQLEEFDLEKEYEVDPGKYQLHFQSADESTRATKKKYKVDVSSDCKYTITIFPSESNEDKDELSEDCSYPSGDYGM